MIVLLSGGLGGARLAPALARRAGAGRLTVVANVGDDLEWMGLRISPDADSILYALAGLWDEDRGWGRKDETFHTRTVVEALGGPGWFGVGDRDLALHLWRAARRRDGATPTEVLLEAAERLGVRGVTILPASDEPVDTTIATLDGRRLRFQEWYVRERAEPAVAAVEVAPGRPGRAVLEALAGASAVVLGPSNPRTSLAPILALEGVREAVLRVRRRIAVSPVVLGVPSSDPAIDHHARARARVLAAEGRQDTPSSIASALVGLVDTFVLDAADAAERPAIEALGLRAVTASLLEPDALAGVLVDLAGSRSPP